MDGLLNPYRGFHEVPRGRVVIENIAQAVLEQVQRLPEGADRIRVRLSPENFQQLMLQWLARLIVFHLIRDADGVRMVVSAMGRLISVETHETAGDGIHMRWDVP